MALKPQGFFEGQVTHKLLDLWSVLTAHPQRQTHLCLLTGNDMKLWPVKNCHVWPRNVKRAHSPQQLGIFPEANVITTSLKDLLNPQVILQFVHLDCFVVSRATRKLLPCYPYLPISLPRLEHYFMGTVKLMGWEAINPAWQSGEAKVPGTRCHSRAALSPQQEPTGSQHHLLPTGSNPLPLIKGKGSTEMLDWANSTTLTVLLVVDTYLLK